MNIRVEIDRQGINEGFGSRMIKITMKIDCNKVLPKFSLVFGHSCQIYINLKLDLLKFTKIMFYMKDISK